MTTRLDWALRYAGLGWQVFPTHTMRPVDPLGVVTACSCGRMCSSPGKHPATRNGVLDASGAEADIASWWGEMPDANIAVATGPRSGVYVVDLDGPDAIAAWNALPGAAEADVKVSTGGGGQHVWYATERDLANTHWRVAERVDTRGAGGYVVVPPSLHASGRRYVWLGDPAKLPTMPDWLVALVTPRIATPAAPARLSGDTSAYGQGVLRGCLDRVARAGEGQRNSVLNDEAFALGQWVGGGEISPLGVAEALLAVAPDPDQAKSRRTIAAALRDGANHPRTKEPA